MGDRLSLLAWRLREEMARADMLEANLLMMYGDEGCGFGVEDAIFTF
jgi:hypothetical protein